MGKAKGAASPADAALERVRQIAYALPGTEEKLSHGAPAFSVRGGKQYIMFVDDHHADGRLAVWAHCTRDEQQRLVREHPERYFVPPYVGVRGWVGARLDRPTTDWVELAILFEQGWLAVAPPRLARGEIPAPPAPARPPPRPVTDARVAREALERLTEICLALPGATREREGSHASFLVGKKTFAYFFDNHHGDSVVAACFRGARADNAKLVAAQPGRFTCPAYIGPRGWLGVRVDLPRVDWKDVAARAEASYRAVAPKRLVAAAGARRPARRG